MARNTIDSQQIRHKIIQLSKMDSSMNFSVVFFGFAIVNSEKIFYYGKDYSMRRTKEKVKMHSILMESVNSGNTFLVDEPINLATTAADGEENFLNLINMEAGARICPSGEFFYALQTKKEDEQLTFLGFYKIRLPSFEVLSVPFLCPITTNIDNDWPFWIYLHFIDPSHCMLTLTHTQRAQPEFVYNYGNEHLRRTVRKTSVYSVNILQDRAMIKCIDQDIPEISVEFLNDYENWQQDCRVLNGCAELGVLVLPSVKNSDGIGRCQYRYYMDNGCLVWNRDNFGYFYQLFIDVNQGSYYFKRLFRSNNNTVCDVADGLMAFHHWTCWEFLHCYDAPPTLQALCYWRIEEQLLGKKWFSSTPTHSSSSSKYSIRHFDRESRELQAKFPQDAKCLLLPQNRGEIRMAVGQNEVRKMLTLIKMYSKSASVVFF